MYNIEYTINVYYIQNRTKIINGNNRGDKLSNTGKNYNQEKTKVNYFY